MSFLESQSQWEIEHTCPSRIEDRPGHRHIGIGGSKGIGGTNETQFGHEETLRKPALTVDGYKLVDQGKIQA